MDDKQTDLIEYADLRNTDLVVDRIYQGGRKGNAGDDPLGALVGVSNQGGFRYLGTRENPTLIVLTTSTNDPDWPDLIDREAGNFVYYGDNKKPGHELHDTPRFGNALLKLIFERAHGGFEARSNLPPILVFAGLGTGTYRDMRFIGLLAPGFDGVSSTEDLVAVWKSSNGLRFQNYRALFTILNVPVIARAWISSIQRGMPNQELEPDAWTRWKKTGIADPLRAERALEFRSKSEQLPSSKNQAVLISTIVSRFSDQPTRFEKCAARIAEMMLGPGTKSEVTRAVRDGGRDALGTFRIGGSENGIDIAFAIEAKCYSPTNSVGVKELSRLISRIRHREFGVLVTTSFVSTQAYQEIKEDGHPIIILSGRDIANILEVNGFGNIQDLNNWLTQF